MKLDYSKKYTDKRNSVIREGITNNGQKGFFRLERPNGSPISWVDYEQGNFYGSWSFQNSRVVNIIEVK